jgi:hypothetical protein
MAFSRWPLQVVDFRWHPEPGAQLRSFLLKLDRSSRQIVQRELLDVLAQHLAQDVRMHRCVRHPLSIRRIERRLIDGMPVSIVYSEIFYIIVQYHDKIGRS